ncbi:hypothetical protein VTG60DRAFT_1733 [Thermothelomyces hinnuleus]
MTTTTRIQKGQSLHAHLDGSLSPLHESETCRCPTRGRALNIRLPSIRLDEPPLPRSFEIATKCITILSCKGLVQLKLSQSSFLQHPPDLSQQPHLPENQHNTGAVARRDPQPNKSGSTSSPATASAPRPATPTSDDEVAVTSRWSSDSEDEKESKMKRLKKVLSFSKLRPRKSSFFQKQTATEAGKSAVSVGRYTSGSSGSRRGSKTDN